MLSAILDRFRNKPVEPVNEIYLLVHPFYSMFGRDECEKYYDIWCKSIEEAAQKENTFGMIIPSSSLNSEKYESRLYKFAKKKFNKSNLIIGDDAYYEELEYQELEERLASPQDVNVFARGFYTENCVYGKLLWLLETYGIPKKNGFIVIPESKPHDYHGELSKKLINKGVVSLPDFEKLVKRRKAS